MCLLGHLDVRGSCSLCFLCPGSPICRSAHIFLECLISFQSEGKGLCTQYRKMTAQERGHSSVQPFSSSLSEDSGKGQESELSYIKRRLSKKKKKFPEQSSKVAPKRILSPEIAKLTSEINGKLNPTNFSRETHLSRSDPGYGTPQVSH